MYTATINHFAMLAEKKSSMLKNSPGSFFVGAIMAGAYVGLGIILIFSLAGGIDPGYQKLVMGLSFGIALTLVVFAGSELFTGHTMYMTFGWLGKITGPIELISVWCAAWLGNFAGALLLTSLFIAAGGIGLLDGNASLAFLQKVATYKMNSSAMELVARGLLCNWLVCLAIWMAARVNSDSAKCIVIFWCLFGFIASGYEHSVANMTLLSIALFAEPHPLISISGMVHNLFWVTFGNIIGGSLFMGLGYWYASSSTADAVLDKPVLSISKNI